MKTDEDYRSICSFCAEIERLPEHNLFHQMMGKEIGYTYILKETDNFVVMPGIGSLMPGYLLIVPRDHVLSFGHLSATYDDELNKLLQILERWLVATYHSSVIFFEHGPASFTERGGSCTDHAHLHFVPIQTQIDLVSVMQRDFTVRQVQTMAALRDQIARKIPYLFLRHHDGTMYVCDAPNAISQYLRRDLVRQLELGDVWDWLVFPGTGHILSTIQAFTDQKENLY